jgi:three-Cys-motif partner protein
MGRRMSTKHQSDLLERKIRSLIIEDDGKDVLVCNTGHSWSVAKLLLLGQWADLYSTIIQSNFPKSRYRFVDLLAGAGKTRLKKTKGKLVKGSVFVVDTFSQKHPFSKYILVEKNTKKCEALRQRTQPFGDRCEVVLNDTNKVVDELFSCQTDHNLVFVDNQGFNVEWKTIETVMRAKADIIINYPTASFERVSQYAKCSDKLDLFFGDDSWREATFDRKYSTKLYMNNLKASFERIKREITTLEIPAYVSNIRLGTETYFYDIILVCKAGPYTHYWDDLKNDWSPKNCKRLIDFINDKTSRLDWFEGFSAKVEALDKSKRKQIDPNENLQRFLENATNQASDPF